jgi:hypothetical protein
MLLVTTFVELRVVPEEGERGQADPNSHIPSRSHAAPMAHCTVALRGRFQNGMVVAWNENGMGAVWHV